MDWQSIGSGAGGGFVMGILIALGWSRRITNLEKGKQDLGVCEAIHESVKERLTRIEDKLDNLSDYVRNHHKQ